MSRAATDLDAVAGTRVQIGGIVQGVGFRPTVWRLAHEYGVLGNVRNDGGGVTIHAWASPACLTAMLDALLVSPPALARIDAMECFELDGLPPRDFRIIVSARGEADTGVAPDAAVCPACVEDTLCPDSRRFRYPFTNCTHCGPRYTITEAVPYDRASTTMRSFAQCPDCLAEYRQPDDRRFHAQPNACHACGPRASLERIDGKPLCIDKLTHVDDIDAACTLLKSGEIVAVKGIGGFHLACDATNEVAVSSLRKRKHRLHKPFALMARDLDIVRRYVRLSEQEAALLQSAEAPIVLLDTNPPQPAAAHPVATSVAPRQSTLGMMLPYTPLHHLLLQHMDRPVVMTSGNRSDEPQCIGNQEVRSALAGIATYVVLHNRDIVSRVDDSVVRVMAGQPRLVRRARGYAPASLPLPPGLEKTPDILAMGAELKNTFCLMGGGGAILSQHIGDLEDARIFDDYLKELSRHRELFNHRPAAIAVDLHPGYLSAKHGRTLAADADLPLIPVQHHHAHVAACLADNNRPIDAAPVLGVALDGLGLGGNGLWGGEFLLADYLSYERLGTFKPVALVGGTQAMREPWRNTFAHLMAGPGRAALDERYGALGIVKYLAGKPLDGLQTMLSRGINSPVASSVGRLFDAVAAAVDICRDSVSYEGQAAIELEACIDRRALADESETLAYPFGVVCRDNVEIPYIEPVEMWHTLLGDLSRDTPAGVVAARFHRGLARAIVRMVCRVTTRHGKRIVESVALTGGVFQNKTLLELVRNQLLALDFEVLLHRQVPANDGGLALGQAAIAGARLLARENPACV